MDRARGRAVAIRRAGSLALVAGLLGMAGCASSSSSPGAGSSEGTATASASPGLSVPGTHQATSSYQISAPVSTVVIVSHVGNVTVNGGGGPDVSVAQQAYYSKTAPTTTRTVSGSTLTVTYDCPAQLVCGVAYTQAVPRSVAVRVTAGAGAVRLTGLAGSVTAKASVGLISATGLTSASSGHAITATTDAGAIVVATAQ